MSSTSYNLGIAEVARSHAVPPHSSLVVRSSSLGASNMQPLSTSRSPFLSRTTPGAALRARRNGGAAAASGPVKVEGNLWDDLQRAATGKDAGKAEDLDKGKKKYGRETVQYKPNRTVAGRKSAGSAASGGGTTFLSRSPSSSARKGTQYAVRAAGKSSGGTQLIVLGGKGNDKGKGARNGNGEGGTQKLLADVTSGLGLSLGGNGGAQKDGKLVFVVGAGSSVGAATVRELVRLGYRVRVPPNEADAAQPLLADMFLPGGASLPAVEYAEALGAWPLGAGVIGAEDAMRGVGSVVCVADSLDTSVIRAAEELQARRFVLVLPPISNPLAKLFEAASWQAKAEQALADSALDFTVVRTPAIVESLPTASAPSPSAPADSASSPTSSSSSSSSADSPPAPSPRVALRLGPNARGSISEGWPSGAISQKQVARVVAGVLKEGSPRLKRQVVDAVVQPSASPQPSVSALIDAALSQAAAAAKPAPAEAPAAASPKFKLPAMAMPTALTGNNAPKSDGKEAKGSSKDAGKEKEKEQEKASGTVKLGLKEAENLLSRFTKPRDAPAVEEPAQPASDPVARAQEAVAKAQQQLAQSLSLPSFPSASSASGTKGGTQRGGTVRMGVQKNGGVKAGVKRGGTKVIDKRAQRRIVAGNAAQRQRQQRGRKAEEGEEGGIDLLGSWVQGIQSFDGQLPTRPVKKQPPALQWLQSLLPQEEEEVPEPEEQGPLAAARRLFSPAAPPPAPAPKAPTGAAAIASSAATAAAAAAVDASPAAAAAAASAEAESGSEGGMQGMRALAGAAASALKDAVASAADMVKEEERKKAEEEKRIREEARKKEEEEKKKRDAEERKKREEERKAREAERKKREEERRVRIDAEWKARQMERKRMEEEEKKRQDARRLMEKRRQEEEALRLAQLRQQQAEERRKQEEERRKKEEEKKKQAEAAKKEAEEKKRNEEEEKRAVVMKAQEEAMQAARKLEEEERKLKERLSYPQPSKRESEGVVFVTGNSNASPEDPDKLHASSGSSGKSAEEALASLTVAGSQDSGKGAASSSGGDKGKAVAAAAAAAKPAVPAPLSGPLALMSQLMGQQPRRHLFWETQPVVGGTAGAPAQAGAAGGGGSEAGESGAGSSSDGGGGGGGAVARVDIAEEGPIEPPTPLEQVRAEPYALPAAYEWCTCDVDSDAEMREVYVLLTNNYVEDDDNMFRFDYSQEFLRWALKPPGFYKSWHVGVRARQSRKLVAFITGVPATVRLREKLVRLAEINFLCVHKKLRSKRLAPVLIKEVTRRVHLQGIWQAVYTAGVVLPTPVTTAQYWHRSLNPKKLIDVGFSRLAPRMTMSRTIKLYRLPEQTATPGLRAMERRDVPAVCRLLKSYLAQFVIAPELSEAEIEHLLLPIKDVIDSFVVEDPKTHELTDLVSFYTLPSTIIGNDNYSNLKAAYSFYNVATATPLLQLMNDALILARRRDYDVFNALDIMENAQFLKTLKFGPGDGHLHYYLYNYCMHGPFQPAHLGLVLL
ncbi:unnamed protein product [Closterium sp. Naga37s-1]|nr:unnamed protein product [Closterium sp. Naga37s-1]